MSNFFDSEKLIDSIKRRISIPENQATYTADDLLAFANEEIALSVVPAILSLHEDYLLFSEDVDLEQNKTEYTIPYRAVGNKLYDLQLVDEQGNLHEMSRTTLADQPNHQNSMASNTQYSYSVKNNRIVLFANMDNPTTGSLRFIYYIRPNQLVANDEVGVITNINTTTGTLTLVSIPDDFDTNQNFDFYKVKSPHNILSIDLEASAVNSTLRTITFDPDELPDDLEVGDHVALASESSIPQIPSDLHVYLAQKVAERVLESQGDLEALNQARAKSKEMQDNAGALIDNRVEESPIKLVNRHGALRSSIRRR
jgi:hypothetical protein